MECYGKCLFPKNAFYFCGFYGYIKGFGYFQIQGNDSNEHIKHFSFEALKSNYTVCMSICVMEHNLALWCSSMMINVNPNILTSYVFCLIREYFEISDFPSLDHNPIKSKLSHYIYVYISSWFRQNTSIKYTYICNDVKLVNLLLFDVACLFWCLKMQQFHDTS